MNNIDKLKLLNQTISDMMKEKERLVKEVILDFIRNNKFKDFMLNNFSIDRIVLSAKQSSFDKLNELIHVLNEVNYVTEEFKYDNKFTFYITNTGLIIFDIKNKDEGRKLVKDLGINVIKNEAEYNRTDNEIVKQKYMETFNFLKGNN